MNFEPPQILKNDSSSTWFISVVIIHKCLMQFVYFPGTGTFGRVVLCRHKETKEYSALKVLQISLVIRLKQIEHVKNEKEILAAVQCPFIVNM
jgi:hypothetical protein